MRDTPAIYSAMRNLFRDIAHLPNTTTIVGCETFVREGVGESNNFPPRAREMTTNWTLLCACDFS